MVEAINAEGGILIDGKRYLIQLYYADDQSNPAVGADASERLIVDEGVDFLFGPYSSSVTMAVAPIADKYKVPLITGSAESPLLWKEGFKYTFGTIPAGDLTVASTIQTIVEDLTPKPKSIFIIGLDDPFAKAMAEGYKTAAEKYGIEVAGFEIVPSGIDYTPLISKAKSKGAELLAVGGHIAEHIQALKASMELDFNPYAIMGHYGITAEDYINAEGVGTEYVWGSVVWAPELNFKDDLLGTAAEYAENSKNRWGALPDYTEAGCAATGVVYKAALEQLGAKPPLSEADRERLVEILENIEVDTFYGKVNFANEGASYHNNVGLTPLAVQILNGSVVIVGPGNLALGTPVYPAPKWKDR